MSKPRAVMVGTYPPTQCGIATYTANLRSALDDNGVHARVIRLLDAHEDAGPNLLEVVGSWRRGCETGIESALRVSEGFDVVLIQHEYGVYPGPDGAEVVDFVDACRTPIITVLHTVLALPTPHKRVIIDALAERSALLIVHTAAARARLLDVHDLDPARVVVVPHGATPNLTGPPLIVSPVPIMLTWGLLGPGKGIEHGIEAVALMRRRGLEVRYLVAGGTHPNVRAHSGEQYRGQLQDLARRRGVADLVEFDDQYRPWESLLAVVRSASLILVPYDTRDQVTSGVLVEALAAGKPVVSTAFPHAVELAATGAVALVRHGSADRIAEEAERILTCPAVRRAMEAAARGEAAKYSWPSVGRNYRELITEVCNDGAPAVGASR